MRPYIIQEKCIPYDAAEKGSVAVNVSGNAAALFKQWIQNAKAIVFLGGAGVSTESGIPDFRGKSGRFLQKCEQPPEVILSHSYFQTHPEQFYQYYRKAMLHADAKPNDAHFALAQLEKQSKLIAVITQNIDGLHQAAGSKNVLELHGSVLKNHCMRCGKFFAGMMAQRQGIPRCSCGGIIKPDVVLYEEALNPKVLKQSIDAIQSADLFIVGGTSLTVYPAAGFLQYFRGDHLVIVNQTPTPFDSWADLKFSQPIGQLMKECVEV